MIRNLLPISPVFSALFQSQTPLLAICTESHPTVDLSLFEAVEKSAKIAGLEKSLFAFQSTPFQSTTSERCSGLAIEMSRGESLFCRALKSEAERSPCHPIPIIACAIGAPRLSPGPGNTTTSGA